MERGKDILDQKEHENFLHTLNRRGFILEERMWKQLGNTIGAGESIARNKTIGHDKNRVEIDALAYLANLILVIECKRTEYSWIFPKELRASNTISILYHCDSGVCVKQRRTSDFISVTSDIALIIENGKLKNKNKKEKTTTLEEIHKKIRQVLKETEAALKLGGIGDKKIFPVIVTNTDLFLFNYEDSNINSYGDITKYTSLKPVPYVAYSFSEELHFGPHNKVIMDEKRRIYDNTKTVFIVNIKHLPSLIQTLRDQDVG